MQYAFDFSEQPALDRHRIVIAYDTPDNRRRRRLSRVALAYAARVQKSVYECELTDAQLRVLCKTLALEIDAQEDDVRVYPQCLRCAALSTGLGRGGSAARSLAAEPRLVVA